MNISNPARDTIALAGWLFADLLLGLGLLFFVAESKGTPPAPTPTITLTPTRTYTPSPTVTRYPTYTRYPTFTPRFTFTPYPTYTPLPPNLTYTPYPTFTDVPPEWTYTPYPTYTPFPPEPTYTPGATYTPYPTVLFGLNGTPYTANLHVTPGSSMSSMQSQLRPQVQQCFTRFDGVSRAGIALLFGTNPIPSVGNDMARAAETVLRQEFPRIFDGTVSRTYHYISGDPAQNGDITAEIYFINQSGEAEVFTDQDSVCNP
ncbi:MAG TPA: hypothetical protein VFD70_08540 [Anaerolineae bacterium]|nr:hypothetical protein [Anaerolineae bacterium]